MTRADEIRALLARAGMSQREAARQLEVNERTMRGWCAENPTAPIVALLALRHLVDCPKRRKPRAPPPDASHGENSGDT